MKYVFNTDDLPLKERICRINGINESELDTDKFTIDYDLDIINKFREKLLSYSDKRFFIVGDYDCDGICATTIMKKLFDDLGISSNYYIPSRTREGYGISKKIVDTANDNGFDVIVCVDNGIIASEELEYAKEKGLKTFIIDHHEYENEPLCDCYLHPDLFPDKYEDMCAGGLCALLSNSIRYDELSTVYGGLATLADMVKVFNYNRYLLKKMLELLNNTDIYPLKYLLKKNSFDYDSLSFNVIPKINAVSRLDDLMNVNYVVRYLLTNSGECMAYLNKIEEINQNRKNLTSEMSALAQRLIDPKQNIIIVSSAAFKEGLCGLVANRLMYEYGKPVLVLSENEGMLTGSGRAPKGSNFHGYLKGAEGLFEAFGGHAQAVGLSLDKNNYDELLKYINENEFIMEEVNKDVLCFEQNEINEELLKQLESLKPFGTGFEEPLLCIDNPEYSKKYVISRQYPKFVLNNRLEAISFNHAHLDKEFAKMIGHLKRDDYHNGCLSFVIEDLL